MHHFKVYLIIVIGGITLSTKAQSLPGKQKQGVFAPENINMDGKPIEWGDFQAYNRAAEVFYTVANTEENLYFVIQAKQKRVVEKIVNGGITIRIKPLVKDKVNRLAELTYPNLEYPKNYEIINLLRGDRKESKIVTINNRLPAISKYIKLSGMETVAGPEISIYNELDIKAVCRVDSTMALTYEVQLPLKYIRDFIDGDGSFEYQVIVNGVVDPAGTIVVGGSSSNADPASQGKTPVFDMFSPTDFKAQYTLIKKP